MKKLFFSIAATLLFIATSHAGVRSLYVPNYGIESGKEHQEKVLYTESNTIRFLLSSEQVHEEKSLYFTPNITTFLRDAEYFLPYMEGYTAAGFLMKPAFSYQHDQTLRATVGVHLTGIAGDHVGIHKVSPIVTLEYAPTKWLKIVGGTLDGNLAHKLYEPMFDFDRYFYKHKEDGLQAFAHTAHWNSEIWCDWEDFITIGADWQEKFTFGWTNEFHIRRFRKKGIEFQLPLHLMMKIGRAHV